MLRTLQTLKPNTDEKAQKYEKRNMQLFLRFLSCIHNRVQTLDFLKKVQIIVPYWTPKINLHMWGGGAVIHRMKTW
jgi:hypothetical protein